MRLTSPLLIGVVILAACAGRTSRRASCPPVPEAQWLAGQPVYRDCSVDREARQTVTPRVEYSATSGQSCLRASIEAVVDTSGRVIASTARTVRSTDPGYAAAVLATLDARRYEPARLEGRAVPQLVRIEAVMQSRVMVVRMGDPLPSGRSAPRPTC
jgi:hypothetical protein